MTEPTTPVDLPDLPEALRERLEPEVQAYVQAGIRRFSVIDPNGVRVTVISHIETSALSEQ